MLDDYFRKSIRKAVSNWKGQTRRIVKFLIVITSIAAIFLVLVAPLRLGILFLLGVALIVIGIGSLWLLLTNITLELIGVFASKGNTKLWVEHEEFISSIEAKEKGNMKYAYLTGIFLFLLVLALILVNMKFFDKIFEAMVVSIMPIGIGIIAIQHMVLLYSKYKECNSSEESKYFLFGDVSIKANTYKLVMYSIYIPLLFCSGLALVLVLVKIMFGSKAILIATPVVSMVRDSILKSLIYVIPILGLATTIFPLLVVYQQKSFSLFFIPGLLSFVASESAIAYFTRVLKTEYSVLLFLVLLITGVMVNHLLFRDKVVADVEDLAVRLKIPYNEEFKRSISALKGLPALKVRGKKLYVVEEVKEYFLKHDIVL